MEEKFIFIDDGNIPFLFASAKHTNVECINHINITMEIVLVDEGTLNMTIGGKEYSIPSGCGAFVPPLESHLFHSECPNKCHVLMFSTELVSYFFEFTKANAPKRHIFPVSAASLAITNTILPNDTNVVDPISAEAVLAPLCHDIYRGCEFEKRKMPFDETALCILEYVSYHFREKISLKSIAAAVGVHPVTVSKIFQRKMNRNFCYYLQYVRCAYAAKLIKMKNMTFAEIAYDSGFGSIRSFNRAFANVYGITPTEYKHPYRKI